MTTNLAQTTCYFCEHEIKLEEPARMITREEAIRCFAHYKGMMVANAICPICKAKYLAWIDETTKFKKVDWDRKVNEQNPICIDLSFRSTFSDEPGDEDYPKYNVEAKKVWQRTGPYTGKLHK